MNLANLIWIIPVTLFVGFQIGSIVEKLKGYNFADLESDILKAVLGKVSVEEQAIVSKAIAILRKLEFWKK